MSGRALKQLERFSVRRLSESRSRMSEVTHLTPSLHTDAAGVIRCLSEIWRPAERAFTVRLSRKLPPFVVGVSMWGVEKPGALDSARWNGFSPSSFCSASAELKSLGAFAQSLHFLSMDATVCAALHHPIYWWEHCVILNYWNELLERVVARFHTLSVSRCSDLSALPDAPPDVWNVI